VSTLLVYVLCVFARARVCVCVHMCIHVLACVYICVYKYICRYVYKYLCIMQSIGNYLVDMTEMPKQTKIYLRMYCNIFPIVFDMNHLF